MDLVLISRSDAPGQLLIAATRDAQTRAQSLQSGQSFYARVVATFRGLGHLKTPVHKALSYCKVEGPSREWFGATLPDVLHVLAGLVQKDTAADTESDED
jgi:hypothetical protein